MAKLITAVRTLLSVLMVIALECALLVVLVLTFIGWGRAKAIEIWRDHSCQAVLRVLRNTLR